MRSVARMGSTGCWVLTLVLALGCASARHRSGGDARPARQEGGGFSVLSINDTYRIEGLDGGTRGGLARVRVLREELEASGEPVLLLHAGDLLYPAMPSRLFDGAQVIDLLNLLDGDDTKFDERMFVTFGNHEFDKAKTSDAPALARRLSQSQFRWLDTNLVWARGVDGQPLVAAPNLESTVLFEFGGLRVGLFSLTTEDKRPAFVERIEEPMAAARRACADLRSRGAELVIALTHLRVSQDVELLRGLGAAGPDLIFGGHEHEAQAYEVAGRWVLKADADAASAVVARVGRRADGSLGARSHEVRLLSGSTPRADPVLERRAREWLRAFDLAFCAVGLGQPAGCLDERLGRTRVELVAEELSIRRYETNVGSWVADLMLAAYKDAGAQVAFVNSGSLRLNQNLPADTEVARRHVEELFAYSAPLRLIEIDGGTLARVLAHSVKDWTGNGWWLQVSGLAFRHDPESESVTDLTLLEAAGPRPILPEERLRVVTSDFLLDPDGGQDGYTMLRPDQAIDDGPGPDLKQLVIASLRAAGEAGIAPAVVGRICNPQRAGPCLAVASPQP